MELKPYQQQVINDLLLFLENIQETKAEAYVVYADNCLLTKDFMTKHNIIFKKIPRDITRF